MTQNTHPHQPTHTHTFAEYWLLLRCIQQKKSIIYAHALILHATFLHQMLHFLTTHTGMQKLVIRLLKERKGPEKKTIMWTRDMYDAIF